uniref:Uncharacterized protein n=1 Tax=Lactuca sativa TaxID=4236 RepID=A0A9R1UG45_LACSA|nr:hypothetical protein LSAT_V11C900470260 [Lactuca sativa]
MACLQNRPICGAMFWQSCFGDYVNMPMGMRCHNLLCHYLMCKEATTFDLVDLKELLFPVGGYRVCFDKKAFWLVTGLRFRDYFHPSSGFAAFREHGFHLSRFHIQRGESLPAVYARVRIFGEIPSTSKYVLGVLKEEDVALRSLELEASLWIWDHCLLRKPQKVPHMIAEGEGVIVHLLTCILETFPSNSIIGSPILGVIPRAVAYPRMRPLHAPDCQSILDLNNALSSNEIL